MLVRDDTDHKTTVGSAAVQCALKKSKLVSFNNCPAIQTMMEDLKAYHAITNENFWFGVFAPGETHKRKSARNFVETGKDWLIDSYVYILIYFNLSVNVIIMLEFDNILDFLLNKTRYFFIFSLGYGIPNIDRPTTHGELCDTFSSDKFNKEKETVFQLKMGAINSHDVESKEWEMYTDVTSEMSGFICEKEGSIIHFSCLSKF